jgi:hypothetical protein
VQALLAAVLALGNVIWLAFYAKLRVGQHRLQSLASVLSHASQQPVMSTSFVPGGSQRLALPLPVAIDIQHTLLADTRTTTAAEATGETLSTTPTSSQPYQACGHTGSPRQYSTAERVLHSLSCVQASEQQDGAAQEDDTDYQQQGLDTARQDAHSDCMEQGTGSAGLQDDFEHVWSAVAGQASMPASLSWQDLGSFRSEAQRPQTGVKSATAGASSLISSAVDVADGAQSAGE